MKTKILIILLFLSGSMPGFGQSPGTNPECKSEMARLGFLTGKWEGTATTQGPDRAEHSFTMHQTVRFKLDTTLLEIERLGTFNGEVIHNELALVTWSKQDTMYTLDSFLSSGSNGRFKGVLKGDRFYWYPYENVGYAITINDKGQWYEIGQVRSDENVIQFLEMRLDKK